MERVEPPPPDARHWCVAKGRAPLVLDRPRVVAILNITPDSFSDGGDALAPEHAAHAAARHAAEGADMLDMGAESTRPGAAAVSASEQLSRLLPALIAVRREVGDSVPMSVDTTDATVAAAALDHGADAINDVSGGEADARMLALAARRGAGIVLMHRLVRPERDSFSDAYATAPNYGDAGVLMHVRSCLAARAHAALAAGVDPAAIVIDPGLGFGKSVEQNLELLRGTERLAELGFPVLSALSRKSFTARAAGMAAEASPKDRLAPTLSLSVLHLAMGARLFRVHDVAPHVQALRAAWNVLRPAR